MTARDELRAAARVAVGCVVLSAIAGIVWGVIAPAEHLRVVASDSGAALTGESLHRFDATAIFICAGFAVGIVTAFAAWQWRRARGVILLAGVLAGSAVGAVTMAVVGTGVARLHFPHADSPQIGAVVALAPSVGPLLALIVQPLVASLVVLVAVAFDPNDDLGTGIGVVVEEPVNEPL